MMKKITTIFIVFLLIFNSISVSANTQTSIIPSLSPNAIAVVDEEGKSNNLGTGNYSHLYGRICGFLENAVDLSNAEFIEFDIRYSDREALDKAISEIGSLRLSLFLGSQGSFDYGNTRGDGIFNFETKGENGWYHYKIPRYAFDMPNADWSAINIWFLNFQGSNASYATGDLSNLTITIRNICATVSGPMLPKKANAVLDAVGSGNTLGTGNFNYFYGRCYGRVSKPVDLSKSEYIEFDIQYSDREALVATMEKIGNIRLSIFLGSQNSFDYGNTRGDAIFLYESIGEDGWYHYKIPKTGFDIPNADWTAINSWFLNFQGPNASAAVGELSGLTITIKNICGTIYGPRVPESAVAVLDEAGKGNSLGTGNFNHFYGRCWGAPKTPVDMSIVDFIEFDVKYSDHDAFINKLNELGIRLSLFVSSNGSFDSGIARGDGILAYESNGEEGWYHYKIPKSGFDMNSADWTKINLWFLNFQGANAGTSTGELSDFTITIKNICGTLDMNNIKIFEGGEPLTWKAGTGVPSMATQYNFGKMIDVSKSEYIEFDFYVSDYDALISEEDYTGHRIRIFTGEGTSDFFNGSFYEQVKQSGWNHIKILKQNFDKYGSADWSKVSAIYMYMEKYTSLTASKDYTFQYSDFRATISSLKIYNVYSDNMLIQQNKPFVIAGSGSAGLEVSLSLTKGDNLIQSVTTVVDDSGEWKATFNAIAGGYDTYSISVLCEDNLIDTIENIVFGELWLASGQSNMEMNNWETPEGNEWYKNNTFPGKSLRFFNTPTTYGTADQKAEPQKELAGSGWLVGDNSGAHAFSAVAYHFGLQLHKELLEKGIDVPVGVIDASLGGTVIECWISREAIESDNYLFNYLIDNSKYVSKTAGWGTSVGHNTMTSCYNVKISPLTDLNIAGVIWYQGETNAEPDYEDGFYTKALEVLLKDWSSKFGFENSTLPFIMAHIAPFGRSDDGIERIWEDMSDCWRNHQDTMAQIPIYDVPLDWDYKVFTNWLEGWGGSHPIHPYIKKPVGERMAKSAIGLVYDGENTYTAPVYESYEVNGKYIDIKFSNVCDGLEVNGSSQLYGFTICGTDGIYVDAKAEIISKDTVRVWNDNLSHPISVAYAYMNLPTTANLCSVADGETLFMAAPFRTQRLENAVYFTNQHWMNCDDNKVYHAVEITPDMYNTWASYGADVSVDNSMKYSGTGALKIDYTNNQFSISPIIRGTDRTFRDVSCDYSNFKTLTFRVKSDSENVTLNSIRFEIGNGVFVTPQLNMEHTDYEVCGINGEWKLITVKLDKLFNMDGFRYYGGLGVNSISIEFSSSCSNGTVYVDDFSFSTDEAEPMDANDDGKVDIRDLVRVKKHSVDNKVPVKSSTENIDGEYGVKAGDLTVLRKNLLGKN